MTRILIGLALALGCGLASGCGVSSVNDVSADAQSLGSPAIASPGPNAIRANQSAATAASTSGAHNAAATLTAVSQPGNVAYKIGPLDVLDVSVFKVPELSKTVQVTETGTVNLPLVGEISAGGRTAREVEKELTKTLGDKYLQKPQVTVLVKEYNSQRITLDGAVKKPGVFPMQGGLTLLQALAIGQGLEMNSDSTVVVFREQGGKRTAARFDISDVRSGAVADPQLQAGDVVVAGSSAVKETFNNILKALPIASVFALI